VPSTRISTVIVYYITPADAATNGSGMAVE
jgi:hypothetical protein